MKNPYEDIINLPNHKSNKHSQMSKHDRAAQFSPFAALTGHSSAVNEKARLTDKKVELDEYIKADLNEKICIIQDHIDEKPQVSITCFQPDKNKSGGKYNTVNGYVKKIDEFSHIIMMQDNSKILIDDIVEINSELFNSLVYEE
ncbi:MAG: hypothetical protein SCJ93_11970 [Bacillota bacterium]|nr:hypothetical protein [Bacillota bacterium]